MQIVVVETLLLHCLVVARQLEYDFLQEAQNFIETLRVLELEGLD